MIPRWNWGSLGAQGPPSFGPALELDPSQTPFEGPFQTSIGELLQPQSITGSSSKGPRVFVDLQSQLGRDELSLGLPVLYTPSVKRTVVVVGHGHHRLPMPLALTGKQGDGVSPIALSQGVHHGELHAQISPKQG